MNFAINFDYTIALPGAPIVAYDKAVDTIKKLQAAGHKFILMTTRVDAALTEATDFLTAEGITPDAVNLGDTQVIVYDMDTPRNAIPYKIDADYYIDNKSLGAFTKIDISVVDAETVDFGTRRVDWDQVRKFLIYAKIFTEAELAA